MTAPHDVSILGPRVECTCRWSALDITWGPGLARRLGFAHVAAPHRSTEELLSFVVAS